MDNLQFIKAFDVDILTSQDRFDVDVLGFENWFYYCGDKFGSF